MKRALFAAIGCSLALAATAAAGTRFADVAASSFVIENGATGEVIASRAPDRELAFAFISSAKAG